MEKIAVYGSGTIGSCEATLIIGHGIPCTVIGHSERGLERCRKAVAQNWDDLITNGLASEDNKAAALELLTVTNDPAALAGCTYVFEAVAEGTVEKQAVYEAIAEYAEPDAVVASCSSSIDAEILAGLSPKPENLLIAHPFQPVHMLPLVEVVRHAGAAGNPPPSGGGAEPQRAGPSGESLRTGAVPGIHLPHRAGCYHCRGY